MLDEKFYTTDQVANILQVHPFTILKFIKAGKLKGIKLGRVYRIKESDVQEFIEDRMTQPSSTAPKKSTPKKVEKEESETPATQKAQNTHPNKDDHFYII